MASPITHLTFLFPLSRLVLSRFLFFARTPFSRFPSLVAGYEYPTTAYCSASLESALAFREGWKGNIAKPPTIEREG